MEIRVRRNQITAWYPVEHEMFDTIIEVPDEVADQYEAVTQEFIAMSDAIEAQVRGTS